MFVIHIKKEWWLLFLLVFKEKVEINFFVTVDLEFNYLALGDLEFDCFVKKDLEFDHFVSENNYNKIKAS